MDFKDNYGNLLSGAESIFPIIHKNNQGLFEFLGTGFFIGPEGEFITAKHVLLNDKNKNIPYSPCFIVQSIGESRFLRNIEFIFPHEKADLLIGKLHNSIHKNGKNFQFSNITTSFILDKEKIKLHDNLKTYAFAKSNVFIYENKEIGRFTGNWYVGKAIEHFPNGRDNTFLPDECYQTNIEILGGSSGGPVFNLKSKIVGVNSTGYELLSDEHENISFITPINKIWEMEVNFGQKNETFENYYRDNIKAKFELKYKF